MKKLISYAQATFKKRISLINTMMTLYQLTEIRRGRPSTREAEVSRHPIGIATPATIGD